MTSRALTPCCALFLLFALTACDRDTAAAKSPAANPAAAKPHANTPYDLLERVYAPLTAQDDPLGFPIKVRNLSDNVYRFWRGAKEPFYEWCKTNAKDWLDDEDAYLLIHGDLHPGNMGLYHARGSFGHHVAFGAVDFDDSARLPFQIELLQGAITFQLLAKQRAIRLDDAQLDQLIATMLESYRSALDSAQTPTEMLAEDKWVRAMLGDEVKRRDYAKELKKYTKKDAFVSRITDNKDRVKEILRPVKGKGSFADAIEQALMHVPDGKDLFADADLKKKAVEDIARRTQLESAGSEGLHKYLVLLRNKNSPEGKLILYLKQQVPTPAERVGLIPVDARPPGRRASEDAHLLCTPPTYFNSWCDLDGRSYRLSIKEPWTETLDGADVNTFDDMKRAGRIWGVVAGAAHRQSKRVEAVKSRLTPELPATLRARSAAYVQKAIEDFRAFEGDPRTREQAASAEARIKALLAQ